MNVLMGLLLLSGLLVVLGTFVFNAGRGMGILQWVTWALFGSALAAFVGSGQAGEVLNVLRQDSVQPTPVISPTSVPLASPAAPLTPAATPLLPTDSPVSSTTLDGTVGVRQGWQDVAKIPVPVVVAPVSSPVPTVSTSPAIDANPPANLPSTTITTTTTTNSPTPTATPAPVPTPSIPATPPPPPSPNPPARVPQPNPPRIPPPINGLW